MNTATTSLNIAGEIQKDDDNLCYDQNVARGNLGHYFEALASLDQALTIEQNDHLAWVSRAVVLIHLDRYSEALTSCEKALAIHSNYKEAWLFRGVALHYLGQYKRSYASYDKALGIERQSVWQKFNQMLSKFFGLDNSSSIKSGTKTVSLAVVKAENPIYAKR